MDMDLVFVKDGNFKNEPYTTSKVIADCGGQEHRAIRQLIETHKKELQEFGRVTFEMIPLKTNSGVQNTKIYKLNEEQATFLITLMRNTPKVVLFKKNLVKQFYNMRQQLQRRALEREVELNYRKELTAKIQSLLSNDQHKYIAFTEMLYKIVFGKTVGQLRKYYGVDKKITPKDFMSLEDLQKLKVAEQKAVTMLELGYDYYQVKEKLNKVINGTIAV